MNEIFYLRQCTINPSIRCIADMRNLYCKVFEMYAPHIYTTTYSISNMHGVGNGRHNHKEDRTSTSIRNV